MYIESASKMKEYKRHNFILFCVGKWPGHWTPYLMSNGSLSAQRSLRVRKGYCQLWFLKGQININAQAGYLMFWIRERELVRHVVITWQGYKLVNLYNLAHSRIWRLARARQLIVIQVSSILYPRAKETQYLEFGKLQCYLSIIVFIFDTVLIFEPLSTHWCFQNPFN